MKIGHLKLKAVNTRDKSIMFIERSRITGSKYILRVQSDWFTQHDLKTARMIFQEGFYFEIYKYRMIGNECLLIICDNRHDYVEEHLNSQDDFITRVKDLINACSVKKLKQMRDVRNIRIRHEKKKRDTLR